MQGTIYYMQSLVFYCECLSYFSLFPSLISNLMRLDVRKRLNETCAKSKRLLLHFTCSVICCQFVIHFYSKCKICFQHVVDLFTFSSYTIVLHM